MRRGRLRAGEALAGAAGLALLGSMLLTWYEKGSDLSAWEAFGVLDVLLALTALLGVGLVVAAATQRAPAFPVAASVVLFAVSLLVAVALVYRLLDQPGPDDGVRVAAGAWVGLGCLLALVTGSWRAVSDEGADGPAGPEIEARPAPPAIAAASDPGPS
jgi:heme A synthase